MAQQILDRSRDYGTITPPLNGATHTPAFEGSAFYEQDGRLFGQDFRRIYCAGESPEDEARLEQRRKAKAAKDNKARQAALTPDDPAAAIYAKPPWRRNTQHAAFAPKDQKRGRKYPRAERNVGRQSVKAAPKPAATVSDPTVNLTAWALSEEKILFGTVKQEIRKRFNVVVSQERDALAVLVREKVVRAEDIPGYGDGGDDPRIEAAA